MSTNSLEDLTSTTPLLLNGDCLELMKTLPDKSVDLFICDLPYGETNCSWDTCIDLAEFWKQFKRLRKSKRTACIHFCSTGFGYTLIKSWEKGFKMDMVWKKRNKTGGLQSRFRPMRNHEMVYFFYEQAPKYNRDKYHKRIHSHTIEYTPSDEVTAGGTMPFHGALYHHDPPNPASVLDGGEPTIYGATKADPGWWAHNSFKGNENPASVLEEEAEMLDDEEAEEDGIYSKAFGGKGFGGFAGGFEPRLPPTLFESKKTFAIGKRHHQTEKPQDILEFFLKYWSDPDDVILDPTMGSGSTGVACKRMGRKFIGCEMDPKYFGVSGKRIGAAVIDQVLIAAV